MRACTTWSATTPCSSPVATERNISALSTDESRQAFEKLRDLHGRWREGKKSFLLKCAVTEDRVVEGAKNSRWSNLMLWIRKAGRPAQLFFEQTTGVSRKGIKQAAVRVQKVDYELYELLFAKGTFGGPLEYHYLKDGGWWSLRRTWS